MRFDMSKSLIRALGRPATYTAPGGSPVSVRAKVQDADETSSIPGLGSEVGTHDAVAFVAASAGVEPGGVLEQAGTTYEVFDTTPDLDGLVRLNLMRIAGDGVSRWDFASPGRVMRTENVEHSGAQIRAHVNAQAEVFETDGYGVPVQTVRTVILVDETEGEAIAEGDTLTVRGQARHVLRNERTGRRTRRVVVQ